MIINSFHINDALQLISLLAGIWGMNFVNMPELKYPFSYPIALGVMGLLGWAMYVYFRRTGWLD